MPKIIQFNLRIPQELKDKISKSSFKTGRSINAEAQFRLEKTFSTNDGSYSDAINELSHFFSNHLQPKRLQEVSEQLLFLLKQTNKMLKYYENEEVTIPQIAYELDHQKAKNFEEYFLGFEEPTFQELKKLSEYFSASENWLCFKKGRPYISIRNYSPTNIFKNDLLNIIGDKKKTKWLGIIRNRSDSGEVVIMNVLENWRFETITTSIELNNQSSTSNNFNKSAFLIMLRYLTKYFNIQSYLIDEDDFQKITQGVVHPLTVLQEHSNINWVQCFLSLDPNNARWTGWGAMCEQIKNTQSLEDIKKISELVTSSIDNNEPIHER